MTQIPEILQWVIIAFSGSLFLLSTISLIKQRKTPQVWGLSFATLITGVVFVTSIIYFFTIW